jgi:hypothetical protein
MKKNSPQENESPSQLIDAKTSQLIDAKIKELGDWRGEMLSKLRTLIKQALSLPLLGVTGDR